MGARDIHACCARPHFTGDERPSLPSTNEVFFADQKKLFLVGEGTLLRVVQYGVIFAQYCARLEKKNWFFFTNIRCNIV